MVDSIQHQSFFYYIYRILFLYPAPTILTYMWNFGIFALVGLIIQILTGILLAMHYIPDATLAFASVEHIMRDVDYGWLLRYTHANGASVFFIAVYIHLFRNIYYGSFMHPREALWVVGVLILVLMILTAFLGYVLPWGQMSFWAATVITNSFSAIPKIGGSIVIWLWSDYSVSGVTLTKFFSLHYFFPFVILGLVGIHILLLHTSGSNNPLGFEVPSENIPFFPYYGIKDLFGFVLYIYLITTLILVYPNLLGHSDNYIQANPMVTPAHIVPEWYFLPFYAILRSVPDKLGGVIALAGGILLLFVLPWLFKSDIRSMRFRPTSRVLFWIFVVVCFQLGWIGSRAAEYPYTFLGQCFTFLYFLYFLVFGPLVIVLEKAMWSDPNLRRKKYTASWPKRSNINPPMYYFHNGIPVNKDVWIILQRKKLGILKESPLSKRRPYDLNEFSYWYYNETTFDHYRRLRKYGFFTKPRL